MGHSLKKKAAGFTSGKISEETLFVPFVLLIVAFVCYKIFYPVQQVGGGTTYRLVAFGLPVTTGLLVFGYWQRHAVRESLRDNSIGETIVLALLQLAKGVIASYLTFGFATELAWDHLNAKVAATQPVERIECRVESFWTKKDPKIWYYFNGRIEKVGMPRSWVDLYEGQPPEQHRLLLHARRGLLGTWIVDDWDLEHRP